MTSGTINRHSVNRVWQSHCRELAQWAWDRLAIKRDRHGMYSPEGGASWSFSELTKDDLAAHFAGETTLGLGSISPEDQCAWVAWDLDNHSDTLPPDANLNYAIVLMNRLVESGFNPIIEDSDGRGGIHVWLPFSRPIDAKLAYRFSRHVARDYQTHIPTIECFPKSRTSKTEKGCGGGYLRVPGKHHKRNHWSRFWGDGEWLEPSEGNSLLLALVGSNPGLIDIPDELPQQTGTPDWRSDDAVVERARKYVATIPGAVSGSGGHNTAFHVACTLVKGFALTSGQALDVLSEWNATCVPPWSEHELRHKIESASKAQGDTGYLRNAKPERYESIKVPVHLTTQRTETQDTQEKNLVFHDAWQAADKPRPMRECIIEGMLRRGEVGNFIAATKMGKSWFALMLLICIATGRDWLGRRVARGNVLLIDNELHEETLENRISAVQFAMNIDSNAHRDRFEYVACRGNWVSLQDLIEVIPERYPPGSLNLICIDAKYRLFGNGLEENSNDDQTKFHNLIDKFAALMNCPIVLVHHSTKGNQTEKAVTDVGSGGSSQARTVDLHMIIRPHQQPELCVLEAGLRSFTKIEPMSLRWNWPLWSVASDIEPVLPKNSKDAERYVGMKNKVVKYLTEEWQSLSKLAERCSTKKDRNPFADIVEELQNEGHVEIDENYIPPRTNRETTGIRLTSDKTTSDNCPQSLSDVRG